MNDKINQKRDMVTMKVYFVAGNTVISTCSITGQLGLIVDLSSRVPRGFHMEDSQPAHLVINSKALEGVYIKLVDEKSRHLNTENKNVAAPKLAHSEEKIPARTPKIFKNTVSFLTKSDKEVFRQTVQGLEKTKVKIVAPPGFRLVSHYWDFVIISGQNLEHKVYVEPVASKVVENKRSVHSQKSIFSHPFEYHGRFISYSDRLESPVFNSIGAVINNLPNNHDFQVQQAAEFNGEIYYRISDDAWISSLDAIEYKPINIRIRLKQSKRAKLHDCKGNVISRGHLTPGESFYTDRMTLVNEIPFYRVTESAWLDGRDVDPIEN